MLTTLDHRAGAGWHRGTQKVRRQDPHSRFVATVDKLFYGATAVFAATLVVLLVN